MKKKKTKAWQCIKTCAKSWDVKSKEKDLRNPLSPLLFYIYIHPSSSVCRRLYYGDYGKFCRGNEEDLLSIRHSPANSQKEWIVSIHSCPIALCGESWDRESQLPSSLCGSHSTGALNIQCWQRDSLLFQKQQACCLSIAGLELVESNKFLIPFEGPIFSDSQGSCQVTLGCSSVVTWKLTAAALQPSLWDEVTAPKSMAGTICGRAFIVGAAFTVPCPSYVVRLPLLPWRQGKARILFIIESLAAGPRHAVSALCPMWCLSPVLEGRAKGSRGRLVCRLQILKPGPL